MRLSQVTERLDHQAADAAGGSHVFGGGFLEGNFSPADGHRAVRAFGEEDDLGGDLFCQSEEVCGVGAAGLKVGFILCRDCGRNFLGEGWQGPEFWV